MVDQIAERAAMDSDLYHWTGASGRDHEFWVYRLDQEFDAIGALFLYVKNTSGKEASIVYVNQTNRMDLVAKNPLAEEIIKDLKPSYIHVYFNNQVGERKAIMADLILKHNPPGNRE